MSGRSCSRLLAIFCVLSPCVLHAQDDLSAFRALNPRVLLPPDRDPTRTLLRAVPPGTIGFPQIARAAGTIFSGTVLGISRPARRAQSIETVAITFRVDRAIRGVIPGETFTISQWIGLWSSGQRYRIGERVLLFLYPPSKLGLTSCVSAPLGRFAFDASGRIALSAQQLSAFRTDSVLGGKSRPTLSDFALAVRRASGEE